MFRCQGTGVRDVVRSESWAWPRRTNICPSKYRKVRCTTSTYFITLSRLRTVDYRNSWLQVVYLTAAIRIRPPCVIPHLHPCTIIIIEAQLTIISQSISPHRQQCHFRSHLRSYWHLERSHQRSSRRRTHRLCWCLSLPQSGQARG